MPVSIRIPFDSNGLSVRVAQEPGGEHSHTGYLYNSWDFMTPFGTDVLAAADGVVVDVRSFISDGYNSDGTPDAYQRTVDSSFGSGNTGNIITLRHEVDGETFYTSYFHLQQWSTTVAPGMSVSEGQIIGNVGATGNRDGIHLHFQVGSSRVAFGSQPNGYVDPDGSTTEIIADSRDTLNNQNLVTFQGYGSDLPSSVVGLSGAPADISGNSSTGAFLDVGSSEYSTIDAPGDSDWFKVYLEAGETYSFAVRGSESDPYNLDLYDPNIRIRDPNGNALTQFDDDNGGGARDARISGFTAPTSGEYYIVAYAANGGTGSYRVSAIQSEDTPSTPTGGDISGNRFTDETIRTDGQIITSSIDTAGDHDWFEVSLDFGRTYTIEQRAANGSNLDSYLRLMNSNGDQIDFNDDGGVGLNSELTFTANGSGTYYVNAGGYGDYSTGAYELEIVGVSDNGFAF